MRISFRKLTNNSHPRRAESAEPSFHHCIVDELRLEGCEIFHDPKTEYTSANYIRKKSECDVAQLNALTIKVQRHKKQSGKSNDAVRMCQTAEDDKRLTYQNCYFQIAFTQD